MDAPGSDKEIAHGANVRPFVGDNPFAWVDDDIGVDALDWAAVRSAPTPPLAIRGDKGLLAPDVHELERFARRLAAKRCLTNPTGRSARSVKVCAPAHDERRRIG